MVLVLSRARRLAYTILVLAAFVGCSGSEESSPPGPPACSLAPIDAFKELVIVDEAVLNDARARNESAGPWSFRHAVEVMAPEGKPPSAFVFDGLRTGDG